MKSIKNIMAFIKYFFVSTFSSGIQYGFPIINEHIPFLEETYQKWIYQGYISDEIIILGRSITQFITYFVA